MTAFRLHPPEIGAHEVLFRWDVEPASELYHRTEFYLRFPGSIDLARVPERVWHVIALICLHPHWVLLRPCRVKLPYSISPEETEFWYRLLDAAIATLEASREGDDFSRSIEICGSGPDLTPSAPLPDAGRCATAFSGGKDSLVQAGLLAELTERPLLVATTSPMPNSEDQTTPRRHWVFEEIQKRRDVEFVEVESDLRSAFYNSFPWGAWKYKTAVNELTDTFLYFSSMLAVGVASGATHLFMASEVEVQENAEHNGRIIQHTHFMYSAVTMRAMEALLAPLGVRFGSLTSPLHSAQVQQLLWTRYADLRDLQHSCYKMQAGEAACSHCSDCLKIALNAVISGDRPSLAGIKLGKVLREMKDWTPRELGTGPQASSPNWVVSARLSSHLVRYLLTARLSQIAKMVAADSPGELFTRQGWRALASFVRLRDRARKSESTSPPGYRPGFLALVDPFLRERAGAIFAETFPAESEDAYREILDRSRRLAAWITEPLEATSSETEWNGLDRRATASSGAQSDG